MPLRPAYTIRTASSATALLCAVGGVALVTAWWLRGSAEAAAPTSAATVIDARSSQASAPTFRQRAAPLAPFRFHATPDVMAWVHISAVGPLCVGQAGFTIEIGSTIEESL